MSLLGITLDGPAPLGTIHLPWLPGLNVLYGANGAGKTSVLRGIARAFSGINLDPDGPLAILHFSTRNWDQRVLDESGFDVEGHSDFLTRALSFHFAAFIDEHLQDDRRGGDSSLPSELSAAIRSAHKSGTPSALLVAAAAVAREGDLAGGIVGSWPRDPLVSLVAVGQDTPRWAIYASATDGSGVSEEEVSVGPWISVTKTLLAVGKRLSQEERDEWDAWWREWNDSLGVDSDCSPPDPSRLGASRVAADVVTLLVQGMGGDGRQRFMWPCHNLVVCPDELDLSEQDSRLATTSSLFRRPGWVPFRFWRGFEATPSWVPIPFVSLGVFEDVEASPDMPSVISDLDKDLDALSSRMLRRRIDRTLTSVTPVEFEREAKDVLDLTVGVANDLLRRLVSDMPIISYRFASLGEMQEGKLVVWQASDVLTGQTLSIECLSAAQQRWATLAVVAGFSDEEWYSLPSAGLLIDEPELALHRQATGRLASELAGYSEESDLPVFVASHSVEFLAHPDARLYLVSRSAANDGLTDVVPVDRDEIEGSARALGLEPIDLLQLVRTFVMVEGEHDKAVLEETVDLDLARSGTRIIPLRGSDKLDSFFEDETVFKYTSAHVMIVLDGISDRGALAAAWDEAREHARVRNIDRAKGRLTEYRNTLGRGLKEEHQLLNFASRSLEGQHFDRIELFGFAKRDIIEYLPPLAFGLNENWEALEVKYRKYRDVNTQPMNFKQWLRVSESASISTEEIRAAASSLPKDSVQEFSEFAAMIDRPRSRPALFTGESTNSE